MKNKDYLILRFDLYAQISKSKNEDKMHQIRWKYAQEHTKFNVALFNKFCSKNFDQLGKDYFINPIPYKKDWVIGVFPIGMDMLQEEQGLITEHQWMYLYYKIPLNNPKLIAFFKEQKFSFNVKVVSKI